MRIAAYNVENLFDRAKAFNEKPPRVGGSPEEGIRVEPLVSEKGVSPGGQSQDAGAHGVPRHPEVRYRRVRPAPEVRGQLIKRKKDGTAEIVASGRSAWVGWAELRMAHLNEIANQNTGEMVGVVARENSGDFGPYRSNTFRCRISLDMATIEAEKRL